MRPLDWPGLYHGYVIAAALVVAIGGYWAVAVAMLTVGYLVGLVVGHD
jgi:hypothetical protein